MKNEINDLVKKYSDRLYCVILNIVRNHHCAEDALQETFIKVLRYYDRFKHKSSEYTWIYRIAVNTAINYINKENRIKEHISVNEDLLDMNADTFNTPMEFVETNETYEQIKRIINKMSVSLRSVMVLKIYENMTINEISEILEVNKKTVTWRIFQARKIIKQELETFN